MKHINWLKYIKLLVCCVIPCSVLFIPTADLPIAGLTIIQHRLLAIFILAALLWILEPVPVFATSLLIITLEVIMLSDQGLAIFRTDEVGELGTLLAYQDIFSAFASPIIVLFLGGFSLAIAANKYELDINLSRVLLSPFGHKPENIMLGLMLLTALFSMFMSNTATTVMMLSLLTPIIIALPKQDLGIKALVLAIPISANTGGIATPIGTPPNAIALQYLTGDNSVSFIEWMQMGVPFVMLQLVFAWWLLQRFFPFSSDTINLTFTGHFQRSWQAIVTYLTFAGTIMLWLTSGLHGMNTYVVAIIPLAIFTLTGIIGKEEIKQINWEVLWLVAGGIAIGIALDKTGLASALATSIDYGSFGLLLVVLVFMLVCWTMANFISNTAAANLLMPIAVAVAVSMGDVSLQLILVVVAFSASLGMILPVSTPPNSLAYASGFIEGKDMAKVGAILGCSGLLLLYIGVLIFI